MYESFFQLQSRPFAAAPVVETYFPGRSIEHARQTLIRTIERAEGPGLVIGPAGTGKSLLLRLLADYFLDIFHFAHLSSARITNRKDLLQNILFELDLPYRDQDESELRLTLLEFLRPSEFCPHGMLLLVDEAHTLTLRLLDEIRMISNLVSEGEPRIRLVLAGDSRLDERFANPKLASFNQRIAARCYLEPMQRDETIEYVRAQILAVGGNPAAIFTEDAFVAIHRATDGIPRLINQVCDHALVMARLGGQSRIDSQGIEEAWADLQQLPGPWQPVPSPDTSHDPILEFGTLEDDLESTSLSSGQQVEKPLATTTASRPESISRSAAEAVGIEPDVTAEPNSMSIARLGVPAPTITPPTTVRESVGSPHSSSKAAIFIMGDDFESDVELSEIEHAPHRSQPRPASLGQIEERSLLEQLAATSRGKNGNAPSDDRSNLQAVHQDGASTSNASSVHSARITVAAMPAASPAAHTARGDEEETGHDTTRLEIRFASLRTTSAAANATPLHQPSTQAETTPVRASIAADQADDRATERTPHGSPTAVTRDLPTGSSEGSQTRQCGSVGPAFHFTSASQRESSPNVTVAERRSGSPSPASSLSDLLSGQTSCVVSPSDDPRLRTFQHHVFEFGWLADAVLNEQTAAIGGNLASSPSVAAETSSFVPSKQAQPAKATKQANSTPQTNPVNMQLAPQPVPTPDPFGEGFEKEEWVFDRYAALEAARRGRPFSMQPHRGERTDAILQFPPRQAAIDTNTTQHQTSIPSAHSSNHLREQRGDDSPRRQTILGPNSSLTSGETAKPALAVTTGEQPSSDRQETSRPTTIPLASRSPLAYPAAAEQVRELRPLPLTDPGQSESIATPVGLPPIVEETDEFELAYSERNEQNIDVETILLHRQAARDHAELLDELRSYTRHWPSLDFASGDDRDMIIIEAGPETEPNSIGSNFTAPPTNVRRIDYHQLFSQLRKG